MYLLRIIVLALCYCALSSEARAAKSLSVAGGWNQTIDAADLNAGPGSDLKGSYTSPVPVRVTVSGAASSSDGWRIEVRRVDGSWDPAVRLYMVRTSAGTGPGSVSGGLSELEVTGDGVPFFTGTGDRDDIMVLMRLSGVSVRVPPRIYGSSIVYTLVDLP